jgi:hypothetical protein
MTAHRPHPRRVSRRAFLGATATAAGFAALPSAARATGPAAAPAMGRMGRVLEHEWARSFARPGLGTAAGFRWWWPHGLVDPAEVAREVDQVADAGFGVLEVADVTHSLRARGIDIDTETYGWSTPAWVEGVKAALTQAVKRNVRIDLTVGPSWPAAVPTITPDDPAACTELVHGRARLPRHCSTGSASSPLRCTAPHRGRTTDSAGPCGWCPTSRRPCRGDGVCGEGPSRYLPTLQGPLALGGAART